MFLEGLDELDRKIVGLLIENARMSYSDIGEQIGISRVAVRARIQALEEAGVIEEYTTIINPQKISGAVSCYFELEIRPDGLREAESRLMEQECITQIYRVTGNGRLHVHAVAASGEEMERLIRENALEKNGCTGAARLGGGAEMDAFIRQAQSLGQEAAMLWLMRRKGERYGYHDRDFTL
mgnify:CR=1 FL=1